jgi:hypothetical protein
MDERLIAAAAAGDSLALQRLLNLEEVNPNATDGFTTALETAALEGHVDAVQTLIMAGADLERTDANGWTSLHNAVAGGHLAVVRALINAGANVNATTIEFRTPLHLVSDVDPQIDFKLISGSDARGRTAFFAPALVQTLCAAGAIVNAKCQDGSTPLHEAAAAGASSTVLALLSNGANVTLLDARQSTPLEVAGTLCNGMAPDSIERLRAMLLPEASVAPMQPNDEELMPPSDLACDPEWESALNAVSERLRENQHKVKRQEAEVRVAEHGSSRHASRKKSRPK